jgi:hypothetical protein
MTIDKKRTEKKAREREILERRISQRFAWLGPMLERRKAEAEPIEDPDEGEELEEIED